MTGGKVVVPAEVLHLRSMRVQALALVSHIDARLQQLTGETPTEDVTCPACGGTEFGEAGDVLVCAACNANVKVA